MKQFSKDLGNVCLAPKGKWSREQEYERLALVYNACDNLSYVAKINVPSGVDIENREYWQPMNATGYADNNFINLTTESETGTVTAYESLEEAVATILPINRRAGATLSFYNINADRLDRQAEFELWQFNSTDLANWENKDYWNNIYYNWNVFAGWYVGADALKNHVETPNVGQYAYVGSNLNDALLYQCRTNGTWTNTGIKVRNYISVVVSGNITIGENGNWFSDGEDTGIPATPAVDEQLDNIIAKHESLSRTVQGIAVTGGASTATNVTYNNDASRLNAENAQDAIDELQSSKFDKTSILQESGTAINKVMSQGAIKTELDKKIDKSSIAQELGTALDKIMSQKATSTELNKKANTADVDTKFTEEKKRVDAELAKKFDKESVMESTGESADKTMSQKAITAAIADETTRAKAAEKTNAETITNEVAKLDEKINDKTNEINVAKEEALQAIAENEQSVIANFNSQRITPEMLSESTKQLIEASGGGTITNLADDEDLASVDDGTGNKVLKFSDRTYNPNNFSGKGYKCLRKNIQKINLAVTKITVNSAPTKDGKISVVINNIDTRISLVKDTYNTPAIVAQTISDALVSAHTDYNIEVTENIITLTRKHSGEVFSSAFDVADTGVTLVIEDSTKSAKRNILTPAMINQPNTIYEIRYDFDLNGETINIPENCILKFEGGCLNNGHINFNNTSLETSPVQIFNNIEISGEVNIDKSYCEWFGGGFNCDDSTNAIKQALKLKANEFIFYKGTYNVSDTITFNYGNIRINHVATVKAIANMDCLILFNISNNLNETGLAKLPMLNYITGGGCIDGAGLANKCIALLSIVRSSISDLRIKNGIQYCLELNYGAYKAGSTILKQLYIFNELLIKDAIGIHANNSDSEMNTITLVDFKHSILVDSDIKCYDVHGWALHSDFYKNNDCEIWKESALFVVNNDLISINCENDTLRYLYYNDNTNNIGKVRNVFNNTYSNKKIIGDDILKLYPQSLSNSDKLIITDISTKYNPLEEYKLLYNKIICIKIPIKINNAMGIFEAFPFSALRNNFRLLFSFSEPMLFLNIKNNGKILNPYVLLDTEYIYIYINIPNAFYYHFFYVPLKVHITINEVDTIPNTAKSVLSNNINNVIVNSNYFNNLNNINTYDNVNEYKFSYISDIKNFAVVENKNTRYINTLASYKVSGETTDRPTKIDKGFQFFDTTINKPIWWTGTKWVDATGADI